MNDLIFDRTYADVAYAKAHPESILPLRGCYNAVDLNRVGEWCDYLAGLFKAQGYMVQVQTKTNWVMADFPTEAAMALYLGNVVALRQAYTIMPSTPALPTSMASMEFNTANSIEKNISDMLTLLGYMIAQLRPAGTFYAREE